jgi:hypothetical protein
MSTFICAACGCEQVSLTEQIVARDKRIAELEETLRFYADPFAYQSDKLGRDSSTRDWEQIPDFYDECDFGARAIDALSQET